MYNIKKIHILLLLFLICISSVHAISFEVNAVPVKDKIKIEETAKFELEITNSLNEQQTFSVYSLSYPTWDIRTEPIINPIEVDVAPGSKETLELLVNPLDVRNIIEGPHIISVRVKSKSTNDVLGVPLKVGVISREALIEGYVPTIVMNVKIPGKVDPREDIPVEIILDNQNIINYSDLKLKIDSNLIKDTIDFDLGAKEEKEFELSKKLDPLTQPQKDVFSVSILMDGKVISGPLAAPLEITEYAGQEKSAIKKTFLKAEQDIIFQSNNKDYSGKIKAEVSFFKSLFSSTRPKAETLQEDNKRYFVWDVELDENNSMKVSVITNYSILFFAIILAIVLILVYYRFRSPMAMRKEAKNITKKEGGIFSLKVVLHIKNRSNKKIEDIELREVIPNIASIEKDISIGTLRPSKILRHEKKGSIIKWDIDHLDVGEERVLSYKIKARLPILGELATVVRSKSIRKRSLSRRLY